MTIICITETLDWDWLLIGQESLLRWSLAHPTVYVDQLPEELEGGALVSVVHDATVTTSREQYLRTVLRGLLQVLPSQLDKFLLVYQPVFLKGPLPNPQPVQGVDKQAQAYAALHNARPCNWLTGVPVWCDRDKARLVLDELDELQLDLHFVQAYCTAYNHDYLHPTNVLMLESVEDVYQESFNQAADSCNVLVMPWQSHCARLSQFLLGVKE